jgi:hypothetical protein
MLTHEQSTWLREFRRDALTNVASPWLATLYTAIAAVESAYGARTINNTTGLNEIGYAAVPDRPSIEATETSSGKIKQYRAFTSRAQELDALDYLAHHSKHYVDARAAFALNFLTTYSGLTAVDAYIAVFNQLANDFITPLVYPIPMPH